VAVVTKIIVALDVVEKYQTLRHIPEDSNLLYRYVCLESNVEIWMFVFYCSSL
jgi:hypothetical protein